MFSYYFLLSIDLLLGVKGTCSGVAPPSLMISIPNTTRELDTYWFLIKLNKFSFLLPRYDYQFLHVAGRQIVTSPTVAETSRQIRPDCDLY